MSSKLMSELISVLQQQQGVSAPIGKDTKICGDLGVCDEDFQEYLEEVWRRLDMPPHETVHLGLAERDITVGYLSNFLDKYQPS